MYISGAGTHNGADWTVKLGVQEVYTAENDGMPKPDEASEDHEAKEPSGESWQGLQRRRRSGPIVTHLPFRSWHPECVAGSANDWPHKAIGERG